MYIKQRRISKYVKKWDVHIKTTFMFINKIVNEFFPKLIIYQASENGK